LPPRLTRVDELILDEHGSLTVDDECYFLREYTRGGGYQASDTNQLITNLKKSTERRGQRDYRYKQQAIEIAGRELGAALKEDWLKAATLVPIPPSASREDPLYDDRMTKVIRTMTLGLQVDVRELIVQRESTAPAHLSGDYRPRVAEIFENYEIDQSHTDPPPNIVGLFDDILTAGSHFRAAKLLLQQRFGDIPVVGIFIARRVFPPRNDPALPI
jgi:predicted amidophosphoribosyltransferase